jgi:hypothetical protein
VQIGDKEWSVVDAAPVTARDYTRTKALTLTVCEIEHVAPENILYSLPTICDAIGSPGEEPRDGTELVIHEDDWRQIEFVSEALSSEVDRQFHMIAEIYESASVGEPPNVAFRNLHVREQPESPLTERIALTTLARLLGHHSTPIALAYQGSGFRIVDGYAYGIGASWLYGNAPNGMVESISLAFGDAPVDTDCIVNLRHLATQLNLELVFWCRCLRIGPDDPKFVEALTE